ncbi:MAG: hypothetical protein E6J14_03990 [Chloroflexi bacterium]|nr:MAG: hypothetical protein E6J14_03990 [Chloroflexota bacterium]
MDESSGPPPPDEGEEGHRRSSDQAAGGGEGGETTPEGWGVDTVPVTPPPPAPAPPDWPVTEAPTEPEAPPPVAPIGAAREPVPPSAEVEPPLPPPAEVEPPLPPRARAPAAPAAEPETPFGTRLASQVLLTLSALTVYGGLHGLLQVNGSDRSLRAIIFAAAFVALFSLAFLLRAAPLGGELRSALAVVALLCVPAMVFYGLSPDTPSSAESSRVAALAFGLTAIAGLVSAVLMPSAVAGSLAAFALVVGVGSAVAGTPRATSVDSSVAAGVVALLILLLAPRLRAVRPHPAGLRWLMGSGAVLAALSAIALVVTGAAVAEAAAGITGLGLLVTAGRRRSLPFALTAFAVLAALEAEVLSRATSGGGAGASGTLVAVLIGGFAVAIASSLLARPGAAGAASVRDRSPTAVSLTADQLLYAAAGILFLASLGTSPSGVIPSTPVTPSVEQGASSQVAADRRPLAAQERDAVGLQPLSHRCAPDRGDVVG